MFMEVESPVKQKLFALQFQEQCVKLTLKTVQHLSLKDCLPETQEWLSVRNSDRRKRVRSSSSLSVNRNCPMIWGKFIKAMTALIKSSKHYELKLLSS